MEVYVIEENAIYGTGGVSVAVKCLELDIQRGFCGRLGAHEPFDVCLEAKIHCVS